MKLWQKETDLNKAVEAFTVGDDRIFDKQLAPFDILGSLAHVTMLSEVGLLEKQETQVLLAALKKLYKKATEESLEIAEHVEDIHSMVELLLTEELGDAGKKIHSGRSRNDQVLVDLKLYLRHEIEHIAQSVKTFFDLLIEKSEEYRNDLLPGYTHLQMAMPSSFGLWLAAYAESFIDDLMTLNAAYKITNKNPLGSAAGYGSSFPLNRKRTTELLGFDDLNYNVVYAQMGRGKTEKIVAQALANIAATLSKLAMDACLFMNQNFGFITFPEELTTGSSIMPHKKNPDVWELIRGHCNKIQALPNEIAMMTVNLPSGYHRDLQLLKENLFPALHQIQRCFRLACLMIQNMDIKKNILDDKAYQHIFSVEEVNKLVLKGFPFRDAYKQVGHAIANGTFIHDRNIMHTHEGSINNLCNDQLQRMMDNVLAGFAFEKTERVLAALLK